MNHKHRYLGLALAGLIGIGIFAVIRGGAPAPKKAGQTQDDGDDVPPTREQEQVGSARAYELTFAQEVAPEHGTATRLAIRARLEITPRDAAGRDLVRVASVVAEGEGLPGAGELETVFARSHNSAGGLETLAFRSDISPAARDYLKAIAASIQFTGGAAPSDREWRATEIDVGGKFASSYRRIDDGHVERFRRQFLGNPEQVGPSMGLKVEGLTRFAFDRDGALGVLETQEHADLSFDKAWRLQARLSVSLVHVGDAPAGWRLHAGTLARESVVVRVQKAQSSVAADRARLGGRTLADLRAQAQRIEGITNTMERARARSQLLLDHGALIRLNPGVAIEIAERMKDAATSASEVSLLAGSLAAAGTPDASHVLGDVLGEAKQTETRTQAAVALNVATSHDKETLDALTKGMADPDPDVASTSTLALGSASRTLRNGGGSGAEAAQALTNAYREATSIEGRIAAIRAIGNSGDSSLLSLVEQAMQDAHLDLQEAAVYALRFMDASAEPLLTRALASALPDIRAVAVRAIDYRSSESMNGALQGALAREVDPDLRAAIQRLLARAA